MLRNTSFINSSIGAQQAFNYHVCSLYGKIILNSSSLRRPVEWVLKLSTQISFFFIKFRIIYSFCSSFFPISEVSDSRKPEVYRKKNINPVIRPFLEDRKNQYYKSQFLILNADGLVILHYLSMLSVHRKN